MRPPLQEIDEVLASYLYAVEGRTQAEIARELNYSPAVISRVLAKSTYYVQEKRFDESTIDPGIMAEVRTRLLSTELSSQLDKVASLTAGRIGPRIRVFDVAAPNTPENPDKYLESFASLASGYVLQLISHSSRCAITWGRVLANLVKAGNRAGLVFKAATEVIPVAGEPLGFAQTMVSSSIIADELQRLLSGGHNHARSLTMVPALIPRDFSMEERGAIKKLIARLRDYQEIFGDSENRLASSVDAILTSVGRVPLGFANGSLLEGDERDFFVGDIGGVLLTRQMDGDTPASVEIQERVVLDLSERWTGLRLADLRVCADRAAAPGAPPGALGVVVVSAGADRAAVIFECVKRGLVSHLVVDSVLKDALLVECARRGSRL